MLTKPLIGLAALLTLTTLVACSQTNAAMVAPRPVGVNKVSLPPSNTFAGSYIVKASGDGGATIRSVFAQYGVLLVNPLGNEQYELRLQNDPGIDVLNDLATKSGGAVKAIQPNFIYKAN